MEIGDFLTNNVSEVSTILEVPECLWDLKLIRYTYNEIMNFAYTLGRVPREISGSVVPLNPPLLRSPLHVTIFTPAIKAAHLIEFEFVNDSADYSCQKLLCFQQAVSKKSNFVRLV